MSSSHKRTLYLIQQAGMLMQMPRTHKRNLGNTFDTVASHSHHTAIIAYCIARMEGLSHAQGLEAIAMAVFHDLPEARTLDADFASKHYVTIDEQRARKDTYAGIDFGHDVHTMMEEYEQRKSMVSQCVKDADLLEDMYQDWVLAWQGNKLANRWFEDKQKFVVPKFYTKSAQKLVSRMKDSNPQQWWWDEFVTNNYDSKKLTGR
ncbi:MAG TPA: HD domain-containing protein [Candidatus Woesebacteria bacterium]|nr:HD domain-containing protein [Candidatus Woesebacteria bacterium]HNS94548.1 HD domain-containing protein [Candidatus Woesebacteria bacterium]